MNAAHLAALTGSRASLVALALVRPALITAPDATGRLPRDLAAQLGAAGASCLKWLNARAVADTDLTPAEDNAIAATPAAPAASASGGAFASPRALTPAEMQSVNRWGFVDVEGTEYVYEPTEADIRKEVLRAMKWMKMFDEWNDKFRGSDKLAERVDKGVPDAVRALAWMRLAGATPEQRQADVYPKLLPRASPHGAQIKKDIHRTFPRHVLFRDAEGSGQQALFNVLKNFSLYDERTGYCVPSDHEILTSRGFLDLEAYEAAAAADANLLVASYNVAAKALVFEKPKKLVTYSVDTELVELSNANEMLHVWSADSDSHGLKAGRSNGVSMLVTKDHDVFAQIGNASVEKNGSLKPNVQSPWTAMPDGSKKQAPAPHDKIKAGELLESTKKYNAVRQLAVAEAGVQKETVPDVCGELGLRTPKQHALFYEIYGFWLGDGTLKYHGPNAGYVVQFGQVKQSDNDWLEASLTELDVQYIKSAASKAGQVKITIQSDAWNRFFAAEYKHKYKQAGRAAAAAAAADEGAADENLNDEDPIDPDAHVEDAHDEDADEDADDESSDAVAKRAKTEAADALSNLKKFASFPEATDRRTATALHVQRVRDAVALTNDAIIAPPPRAAAVAPVDGEGRPFDFVSTANGSYMQPEGIKSAKWFAYWVWRLGKESLRHVLIGLHRADGNVGQRTIYTSSARFRDEIQRVCLMAGYTAMFRCVYKAGTNRGVVQGKTVIATRDSWAAYFAESDGSPAGGKASNPTLFKARGEIRERQYTGSVWCFNMPSGFIWVRRVAKDEHGVVTKASRPLISGNCQGMGFLAGVLLMYMTEEDAFWMLVRIAKNYEMAAMWADSFPNLARGKFVLDRLLQQFMPRVYVHLQEEGLPLGMVADKWFLGWFLYTMPFHVVLRIWDALLGHGFNYIYRIILAIFKMQHDDILEASFEEISSILRFENETAPVDVDKLMSIARSFKLKDDVIVALHAEWVRNPDYL